MNPAADIAVASPEPTVTTEDLLGGLRASPTDLAKLVRAVHEKGRSVVAVSTMAITRWSRDDPESWERVRKWLSARAVRIVES